MIAKLQSPIVAAGIGFAVSVGIGVYFTASAVVPLLEQAAAAAAETTEAKVTPEAKRKGWDFWTIEIENLSNELREERAKLKKQSDNLEQRAARVASEERELEKVRADIEKQRQQMATRFIEINADEMKNIRTLAQTYSALSPAAAVAIIRELDDATVVKILSLMKADVVAPIFEQMSVSAGADGQPLAKRAAALSEKLRLMRAVKATNS